MPYEKVGGNEPVCIADEVPFEIPEGWEWCRLENISTIFGGKRIPIGNKLTTENTGHIYIRVADMKNESVDINNLLYVPHEVFPRIKKYTINKEDIYITVAGTIGLIGKIPIELDGSNLTENADKIVFKFINQNWLIKCMQSYYVKSQIDDAITKVGQPKLAIKRIEDFLIPLPPLQEQQRIVTEIEKYIPLINEYDKLQTELDNLDKEFPEKLKKSILQEAIKGKLVEQDKNDEPASVLLDKIRKEKEKLIKEGKIKKDKNESIIYKRDNSYYEKLNGVEKCIDDEIPFEIPESWEWCRLGSIGFMARGAGIKRNETTENGCPCIRYGEIYTKYSYTFSQTFSFIPQAVFNKAYTISNGDLVYTLTGETKQDIAKTSVYIGNENVAVGGDLAFWKYHFMNSLYLVYFMFSPYCINNKINLSSGDIIVHISVDKISSILIPIPPFKEQERIVMKINNLFNMLNIK